MKKRCAVIILLCVLICVPTSAHSGRTDSKGGHTNHSTGEYHYHHGYPEHQHINGKCPYDFDDKTGKNSGNNSGKSSVAKAETNEVKNASVIGIIFEWCAKGFIALYVFLFAIALIGGPALWIWEKITDIIRSIKK